MPRFIPGLELSRLFYFKAVQPIIDREFPRLQLSAARLGSGSEVLGFDTALSTDHDWGLRLQLFLTKEAHKEYVADVIEVLRRQLPQFSHSTDLRAYPKLHKRVESLYK